MKILVTGGAGFIGSHTTDALIGRGDVVRVLDSLDPQIHSTRDFPDYMNPAADCLKGDVRNPADVASALDDIEAVYHLAAHTGVGQSMYDLRSYVDTNCTGTATLLEAIVKRRRRVKRLVLASSRAVYGEGAYNCAVHGDVSPGMRQRNRMEAGEFSPLCPICEGPLQMKPTGEDHPAQPVSLYGWTKLQQEQLCRHASETLGLEVVMLRYFNVIGSRQSLNNPYTGIATVFYGRVMEGRSVPLYERGLPTRDFVHVRDIVAANVLALDAKVPARSLAINVGSGCRTTVRALAAAVAHACGRDAVLEETTQFRVGDIFACIADLNRARSVLGYEPTVHLDIGVQEFVEWARDQTAADHSDRAAAELSRHGLLGKGRSAG